MAELQKERLEIAEQEARRFLSRIEELRLWKSRDGNWSNGKQIAAVKRASMDLTRALADVRRSPYGK